MKKVIYREVQKPRQIWIWLIILSIALIMWYGFVQQILFGIPFGNKPAPDVMLIIPWLIFGIGFPIVLIFYIKLIVEVREDGVYIRYLPFHRRNRQFYFHKIEHYEITEYDPIEFGGWGIRSNATGGTAYTINEKKAVRLQLKHNRSVIIESRHPAKFVEAIDSIIEKNCINT